MGRRKDRAQSTVIDPSSFGVSFSLKQCRNFNISSKDALDYLLKELGFRRFRLMSYWDEHEKVCGTYDFTKLDAQISTIEKHGGAITLCLGVRQPRWPESHWPKWTLNLPESERYDALYAFIEAMVSRYKNRVCIISWQLENEALNRSFGKNGDFSRARLRREYDLVKSLDPSRPIIISTSNTYGIPLRKPRPDQFGFTLYQSQFEEGRYTTNKIPIWWWSARARLIKAITRRSSFIHELQAEPWGPKAIWEMPKEEQDKSMSVAQLRKNIQLGKQTRLYPIDLWGGEWWYWCHLKGDAGLGEVIKGHLTSDI